MRQISVKSEDDIAHQEKLIWQLSRERDSLCDKTTEMQVRYDHAVVALSDEKKRVDQVHRMHVKLLSVRILEESLQ